LIRQAISCDICGSEKRQTNHWFVAYEQAGELRVSGWTSRHRLRADSKHLCGQTCLHKLMDEFMAKSIASRARPSEEEIVESVIPSNDISLTSADAHSVRESSARLIASPQHISAPVFRPHPEASVVPVRTIQPTLDPLPAEPPRYGSRNWHAEAWQRERERELSSNEKRPEIAAGRRSTSHSRA
jgi:hypothetical protein